MFYGAGKAQFTDPFTVRELYELFGIPENVRDGRVMGTYIEYLALLYACPYIIEEFGEDRTCFKIDRNKILGTAKMFKLKKSNENEVNEYLLCWQAYLNGAVKTLLLPAWSVTVEDKPEDGVVEIAVIKKVDREQ